MTLQSFNTCPVELLIMTAPCALCKMAPGLQIMPMSDHSPVLAHHVMSVKLPEEDKGNICIF